MSITARYLCKNRTFMSMHKLNHSVRFVLETGEEWECTPHKLSFIRYTILLKYNKKVSEMIFLIM